MAGFCVHDDWTGFCVHDEEAQSHMKASKYPEELDNCGPRSQWLYTASL
jgi:hypothetical protein